MSVTLKRISNNELLDYYKAEKAKRSGIFIRPKDYVLGAYFGEKLVGVIGMRHMKKRKNAVEIEGLYVTPELRGQGIAELLNVEILRLFKDYDVYTYDLPTTIKRDIRYGFKPIRMLSNGTAYMVKRSNNLEQSNE